MKVRLYLTTGIAISQLTPEKNCRTGAVQAGWFPLRQVFDSDPDGSGGLLAPFFADLHRYLNRYSCEGIKLKRLLQDLLSQATQDAGAIS